MKIGNHNIGSNNPVYIIAELSANHGQNYDRAVEIIHAMKDSGADAVKLQTYTPDTMTIDCDREEFKIGKGTIWEGRTLYDLYQEAYMPWEWQPKLKVEAENLGIDLFSTPFDSTSVDFLEKMAVPAYKIASFELTDLPLIENVASKGKPMIMSTGMATLEEIKEAVETARNAGANEIALLQCTSAYPALPEDMNLQKIPDLRTKLNIPIGLSDHTLGTEVAVAAVKLGACIVEKHFTLSHNDEGPDSAFSLEPQEFKQMVDAIRNITDISTKAPADQVTYDISEKEQASRIFRRSIFAVEDIAKGEGLNEKNVRSIRPGNGLPPKELPHVLRKIAKKTIERGTPLSWELIE
ncbi:MAG: pseudaminic acid synthase [Kiritimatiellales bacterium]|nr:pseudaminic acid synthase [Kiritimatiellales bacterium]